MKALVKKEGTIGLIMEDVPLPSISDNDVLIKVVKTSICGTDLHIWKWDDWSKRTVPLIIGHKFNGDSSELARMLMN